MFEWIQIGELLEQIVDRLGQDSRQTTNRIAGLKRRIFSLIEAQQSNLKQVKAEHSLKLEREIATDRQLIATQQELFEAILVLEQALLPLHYSRTNVQLKSWLQQFNPQLVALLNCLPLMPAQKLPVFETDSTETIQRLTNDKTQSIEDQIYLANVHLAIQILLTKFNALFSGAESKSLESVAQESNAPSIKNASNWVFDFSDPVTRRATRTAIAVLISLIVMHSLDLPHGDWVVLSAFIVSRDSVGDTLWKAQGRLVGTAFGAVAALAFYALIFRYHSLIFGVAFVTVFPYLYLRPSIGKYGYAKFFQQFAFICFLGSLRQTPSASLLEWRAIDIAIGCAIGLAVALLVLPTWARPKWRQGLLKAWQNLQTLFQAVVAAYHANLDLDQIQRLSRTAQNSVYELDQHLEGRKHESIMSSNSLSQRLALIEANKRIYERLLYLSYLACHAPPEQPLPSEAQGLIEQITAAFEEMQKFIGTRFSPQLPLITSRYRLPEAKDGETMNQPQVNFLLALNPLCDAIEQYGEMRQIYSIQQNQPS